jgi:hypothetical protein
VVPYALQRETEMSQIDKDIHRDLVIASQWKEVHNARQNPADLNGIKYLQSRDRTSATDNLWLLAQDYFENVHFLSENCQLNWKIPQ